MTERLFSLEDISYRYRGGVSAISHVTLEIHAGEKIVLLGPNGCGKSTLQKILAGLIYPTSGQLYAFDAAISQTAMADERFAALYRRKVGFIFQNSDVQLFCASVKDEIMFGPLAAGLSYKEAGERAEELLDYLSIQHLAGRLPQHLSGGEKKKVAIAAVLAVNPEVVIFDEPTNGLDPRTQRWMIDMIEELNNKGKTVITATHQLELVLELAARVIVLGENHTVLMDAKPRTVLDNRELLLAANLIDERYHVHLHGENNHVHVHRHIITNRR